LFYRANNILVFTSQNIIQVLPEAVSKIMEEAGIIVTY